MSVLDAVGDYFFLFFIDVFNHAPVIYWPCTDEFFLCFSPSSFLDWSSTFGGGGSGVVWVMSWPPVRCGTRLFASSAADCHCHGHRNTHCDVEYRRAGRLHDGPQKHVATNCRRQSTCRRVRLSWCLHSRLLPHLGPFVDKVVVVACLPPLWAHPRRDSWLHLRPCSGPGQC